MQKTKNNTDIGERQLCFFGAQEKTSEKHFCPVPPIFVKALYKKAKGLPQIPDQSNFFREPYFESENDFLSLRVFIDSGNSKKQPTTTPRDIVFSTRALNALIQRSVSILMARPVSKLFVKTVCQHMFY